MNDFLDVLEPNLEKPEQCELELFLLIVVKDWVLLKEEFFC